MGAAESASDYGSDGSSQGSVRSHDRYRGGGGGGGGGERKKTSPVSQAQLEREKEKGARPLLAAMVEDVAWAMGVAVPEQDSPQGGNEGILQIARMRDRGQDEVLYSYEDIPKALGVFREGLYADPDVMVRVGPVVGKVTDTSAVILIEVESACDLVVNLARVSTGDPSAHVAPGPWPLAVGNEIPEGNDDGPGGWTVEPPLAALGLESMTFLATGSLSVSHSVEAKRPHTFVFEGLFPNTGYVVFLSGVCEDDVKKRVARFRTLPSVVEALRIVVLSDHRPPLRAVGVANPWQQLHRVACEGPEINVVLHVGTVFDCIAASDEANKYLTDLKSFTKGARKDMEKRARDAFRGCYWDAWGRHEPLRKVLAEVGAHLPIFAPPLDVALLRPLETADGQGEDRQTMLRLSLEVYREYQRALWHAGTVEGRPDVRIDARDDYTRIKSGGAMRDPGTEDVQDREFWTHCGTRSTATVEEWHMHRYGCVCILVLDTKGTLLSKGAKATSLLSALQVSALGQILHDPFAKVLVLASDIPFLLDEHPDNADSNPNDLTVSWSSYPDELRRLLDVLFLWKHDQYPAREVVLISGGPGFGTTGDVVDHKLGLSIPMVITGPMLGRICSPARWQLQGTFAEGRFSYAYRNPVDQWNFCTLDVDLASSQHKPTVEVQMVDIPVPPGTAWSDGACMRPLQDHFQAVAAFQRA